MKIRNDEPSRVTYETVEAAESLVGCVPFLEGFEEGFQAAVQILGESFSVAVYDTHLKRVGWVCHE